MAVKAITAGGTAPANQRTNFLSEEVKSRARILAVVVSWSGAAPDDTFNVFTTRSPTATSEPQPGDPRIIEAMNIRPVVLSGAAIAIPIQQWRMIDPPFRIALSYNNTDDTADRQVSVVMWFDDQPL